MSDTQAKSGNLPITLATWLFILDSSGLRADSADIQAACDALRGAGEGADVAALGAALVAVISDAIGDATDADAVTGWLSSLYGAEHIGTGLGTDRGSRVRGARAYMFQNSLPWLACIIDRFPDGTVGPHWVMIEQLTDVVTCMDPYPWDDLDEEYTTPVVEFMVKWELAGSQSIHFVR
jgi:hypothetical protein